MKSQIEEFCKNEFNSFLRNRISTRSVDWEDVAQIDEPPDYYLSLGKTVFAVEVSMLMANIDLADNKKIPRAGVIASYRNLILEIRKITEENNYLSGAYNVQFSRPLLDFYNIKDQLKDKITEYIKFTRKYDKSDYCLLFRDGRGKCLIKKLHNDKNYISFSGLTTIKWEGETQKDIKSLLQERISEKKYKLRNINKPKILLLYDAYYFATKPMFEESINHINGLNFFNALFIIQENDKYILYQDNDIFNIK
jgi:hypothetical protein